MKLLLKEIIKKKILCDLKFKNKKNKNKNQTKKKFMKTAKICVLIQFDFIFFDEKSNKFL